VSDLEIAECHNRCMARIETIATAMLAFVLIGGHNAVAQDDKLYAGVSGMLSTQTSMQPGQGSSVPTTGVGGTAFGVSGEFGAFLTRTLSLALEVSVPARFESVQYTGIPSAQIDNQHRDLVLSGLLHVHVVPAGPIRLALVGGPSMIQENTLQRTALAPFGTEDFGPYGPETTLSRWTFGLTAGADVGIQVGHHVQIVPQIRFHWIERASLGSGEDATSAFLGLASVAIRPAVGARVSF
jgi:hypothetical protein